MTAFYVSSVCYAGPPEALDAFVAQFPVVSASFLTSITAATPVITVNGLITYSTTTKDFALNRTTNSVSTVQLKPCLVPSMPYDYAGGAAFWAFGFTGVMLMYFSSHLIGLVLKAVRRY